MTVNKFICIVLMWVVSQFICLSFEGAVIGVAGETGWRAILNKLSFFSIIDQNNGFSWFTIPTALSNWWDSFYTLLSFNYSFFQGYMVIVRILLCVLSLGLIWGLISTFRGGTSS